MLNSKFYILVVGYCMGGLVSVMFSDIYMTKTERKVVDPTKPQFYKRFVNDIINKRYKPHLINYFDLIHYTKKKLN